MKRQPVSACVIVRSDPLVFQAIESIRPYVEEVCVLCDLGTTPEFEEKLRQVADKVERFTEFQDGMCLLNFAAARNASFAMATQPWLIWLDSDDQVSGELPDLENCDIPNVRFICPYEYAYDKDGNVTTEQPRERIVRRADGFYWESPFHEVLVKPGAIDVRYSGMTWHHRKVDGITSVLRNHRIIKAEFEKTRNPSSRTLYHYGLSCIQMQEYSMGVELLADCYEKSDYPEEKCAAACRIIQIVMCMLDKNGEACELTLDDLAAWGQRAIDATPHYPGPYVRLAEVYTEIANRDLSRQIDCINKVIGLAEHALKIAGNTQSLYHDPMDTKWRAPFLLYRSYLAAGDSQKAAHYIDVCCKSRPYDGQSLFCKFTDMTFQPGFIPDQPTLTYDVVFACVQTAEAWGHDSIDRGGIGGSETAVIWMAKHLASFGLKVAVYAGCHTEGVFDGVTYRRTERFREIKHTKLLVGWRNSFMLEVCPADVRWLWVHDVMPTNLSSWRLHLADRILALSNWHRDFMIKQGVPADKIAVTRNGIDPSRFEQKVKRNPKKAIYSSSIDRGLGRLLDMWPRIVEKVPGAELHVYYGDSALEPEQARHYREKMHEVGAIYHGRVNQRELAREMLSAGALLYPSSFEETSCITIMEAKAAGLCLVLKAPSGAQYETASAGQCADFWVAREAEYETDGFTDRFIEYSVKALTQENDRLRVLCAVDARAFHDWKAIAEEWLDLLQSDVDNRTRRDDKSRASATDVSRMVESCLPVVHMTLAEHASGGIVFDPRDPGAVKNGGGCRDGFIGLAKALAATSRYRVVAASTWSFEKAESDGVEWVRLDQLQAYGKPEVLFAYYDTSSLVRFTGQVKIASHHTYFPHMIGGIAQAGTFADVNTAPSKDSVEFLKQNFAPHAEWHLLPNGVKDRGIKWKPVSGRILYHTSPDRGLDHLLNALPEILTDVPFATLHVVGDPQGLLKTKIRDPKFTALQERMRKGIEVAEATGRVKFLGKLSREDLDREISEANVFAFPADLTGKAETFSVSLMECCQAGVPIVTSRVDSLGEIYGELCTVEAPVADHMKEFVAEVVAILKQHPFAQAMSEAGKQLAAKYTFEAQAEKLSQIIDDQLDRIAI